jgi:hypothetical protein
MFKVLVSCSISAKQGAAAAASTKVATDICCNQHLRVACAVFAIAVSTTDSCASAAVLLVELKRAVLVYMIACFDVQLLAALCKPCALYAFDSSTHAMQLSGTHESSITLTKQFGNFKWRFRLPCCDETVMLAEAHFPTSKKLLLQQQTAI